MWEANAKVVEEVYGGFVDWKERFYICPACGDPVYECDWPEKELSTMICPVCEFYGKEEEDCDYEIGFDPYMGCFTDDC